MSPRSTPTPVQPLFSRLVGAVSRRLKESRAQRQARSQHALYQSALSERVQSHSLLDERVYGMPAHDALANLAFLLRTQARRELLAIWFAPVLLQASEPGDWMLNEATVHVVVRAPDGHIEVALSKQKRLDLSPQSAQGLCAWGVQERITIARDTHDRWAWFSANSRNPSDIVVAHPDIFTQSATQDQLIGLVEQILVSPTLGQWRLAVEERQVEQSGRTHLGDEAAERNRLAQLLPASSVDVAMSIQSHAMLTDALGTPRNLNAQGISASTRISTRTSTPAPSPIATAQTHPSSAAGSSDPSTSPGALSFNPGSGKARRL